MFERFHFPRSDLAAKSLGAHSPQVAIFGVWFNLIPPLCQKITFDAPQTCVCVCSIMAMHPKGMGRYDAPAMYILLLSTCSSSEANYETC
jgi:hypothetical protein